MSNDDIFGSEYVNNTGDTSSAQKKSEVKSLLKEPVKEEDMEKYGTSKPRRVLIKATITNG